MKAVLLANYLVKYNCVPSKYNSQYHLLTQFTEHLFTQYLSEHQVCLVLQAYKIEKNKDSPPSRVCLTDKH